MTQNIAIKVLEDKEAHIVLFLKRIDQDILDQTEQLAKDVDLRAAQVDQLEQLREAIKLILQGGGAA